MDDDPKARWPYIFAAGLLVAAFLLGLWPSWLFYPGVMLMGLLLTLSLVAALFCVIGLLVTPLTAFVSGHSQRKLWLAPGALLGAVVLVLPAYWLGSGMSDHATLLVMQSRFDADIRAVRDGRDPCSGRSGDDLICYAERGPPARMAWVTHPGFLDNWSGIVFDPTGIVMQADGWDAKGKWRAPDTVTKLFEGDLVSCRHLRGDYYVCSFT